MLFSTQFFSHVTTYSKCVLNAFIFSSYQLMDCLLSKCIKMHSRFLIRNLTYLQPSSTRTRVQYACVSIRVICNISYNRERPDDFTQCFFCNISFPFERFIVDFLYKVCSINKQSIASNCEQIEIDNPKYSNNGYLNRSYFFWDTLYYTTDGGKSQHLKGCSKNQTNKTPRPRRLSVAWHALEFSNKAAKCTLSYGKL